MLRNLTFDKFFKIALLLLISYFLFILIEISRTMRQNVDVGRFQFEHQGFRIFDTKTGEFLNK